MRVEVRHSDYLAAALPDSYETVTRTLRRDTSAHDDDGVSVIVPPPIPSFRQPALPAGIRAATAVRYMQRARGRAHTCMSHYYVSPSCDDLVTIVVTILPPAATKGCNESGCDMSRLSHSPNMLCGCFVLAARPSHSSC